MIKRVVAEMGIAADAVAEFGSAARRAGAPPWPVTGGAERSTPRLQATVFDQATQRHPLPSGV